MQYQARPHQELFHPPLPPSIPLPAINTLIPRLSATISDIDALRARLVEGASNGSLPSWDALLQRYSILLGRIIALSATFTTPPTVRHGASGYQQRPSEQMPLLSQYTVHPLNPLPPFEALEASQISLLAPEAFFQAINTRSIPEALSVDEATQTQEQTSDGILHTRSQLMAMTDNELEELKKKLQMRLEREGFRGKAVRDEIERRSDEIEWAMRVGEDDEDEEVPSLQEKQTLPSLQKEIESNEDGDDDDLFGSDEDEPMDSAPTISNKQPPFKEFDKESWKMADYVRFMDQGIQPELRA
ncbi:uncharacterized protein L203_105030 [Cryptococcus depauperatus CBS 7841]|uniref:Uncharacterized protein n=1 Tax=Cryptococcus depauperatus CBS 7841 TaxID=1295531 RepID=A0A1E3I1B2_9TREE|nr:hypothetical protein L203_05496 [Cryptococcus depauperatus CBS 7841]